MKKLMYISEMNKKVIALLTLFSVLTCLLSPYSAMSVKAANTGKHRIIENLSVRVNNGDSKVLKTIHYDYVNNRYVSLRDLAAALNNTSKAFSIGISGTDISITTGKNYNTVGGENVPFDIPEDDVDYTYNTNQFRTNPMTVDGRTVKYMTFLGKYNTGSTDCYMSITDIAMLLDTDMWIKENTLYIDTESPFFVDMDELEDMGFYDEVYSALVGDATTGEIYTSYMEDLPVPLASTTKLMSYLVLMDAVTAGEISLNDTVYFSENAVRLSKTEDGTIDIEVGESCTLSEIFYAMLLPSSNECTLAAAEHLAGSEEKFVERMNEKAASLGLSDATIFHNCHGLPIFSDSITATKLQNHMSAKDMFLLVSYILSVYPQIKDITSTKEYTIASLDETVKNTNPLLYNMPEVVGLKTGTTIMAGSCLVSALDIRDDNGNLHTIVAMEFGAEDTSVRCTFSEVLLRYGKQVFTEGNSDASNSSANASIPTSAESLIRMLLNS